MSDDEINLLPRAQATSQGHPEVQMVNSRPTAEHLQQQLASGQLSSLSICLQTFSFTVKRSAVKTVHVKLTRGGRRESKDMT